MNYTREELKEIIGEVIFSSHNAIARVQSNSYAEIDKKLAVLSSKFDTMYEDNKVRNGAFRNAVDMFQKNFDKHDIRLTSLETSRTLNEGQINGKSVVIASIIAGVSLLANVYLAIKK